jgi:hypothetical protein
MKVGFQICLVKGGAVFVPPEQGQGIFIFHERAAYARKGLYGASQLLAAAVAEEAERKRAFV